MTQDVSVRPGPRRAWAAAVAAFLVHNVEEVALDLPAWSAAHPVLPGAPWLVSLPAFTIATGVLTIVVGATAPFAMATGPRWSRLALAVFALIMLANAATHLALSLWTSSLMPGAVTAALLVVPVFSGVLWAIRR
jgi:hypothetical protein